MELFFKHLFPYYEEWSETPFAPWAFGEGVLLTVLSFFEYAIDEPLKRQIQAPIFMDSGAFSAAAMGFSLDPYEVAEMHAILKPDFAVPLDLVVTAEDSPNTAEEKISSTIKNTQILLDFLPPETEIIGPLQGLTREAIERLFHAFRELGITKFALGGAVWQSLADALDRIRIVREITRGFELHVFGKFLHPKLLRLLFDYQGQAALADSVDGYGYILASVKGLYIHKQEYQPIGRITEDQLSECPCPACSDYSLLDFQRGDREAQHLLIQHNIHALIALKENYQAERRQESRKEEME
ncbi:MAG: hypothetical protein ACFFGZ_02875 [Candidatus Thorarchaeota archaeon]